MINIAYLFVGSATIGVFSYLGYSYNKQYFDNIIFNLGWNSVRSYHLTKNKCRELKKQFDTYIGFPPEKEYDSDEEIIDEVINEKIQ